MISALIGRTRELARLEDLAREGARLVTLWGPGGIGKTRLAREHAALARARGEHVVFVDLSAARSGGDVVAALADALGVVLEAHDDVTPLQRAAAAQRARVVADNTEQLDEGARAVLVAFASNETRVLATSREALGAEDEVLVAIEPLDEEAALALFFSVMGADSAGDAASSNAVVRAIVARLDALPLAIELAAARAQLLGPSELYARLDRKLDTLASSTRGLPPRHAALRATIAWSWDLLDEAERAALTAVASFAAPFDAALAEPVIAGDDALDLLDRLKARALLHGAPASLRLAESVRDFARERLAERPDRDAVRARYADAVVARVEGPAERMRGGGDGQAELVARKPDLVALASTEPRAALALTTLLLVTGPASAVIDVVDRASGAATEPAIAARLLVARAEALRARGALAEATKSADSAAERVGADDRVQADLETVRGAIARSLGKTDEALAHEERALAIFRARGDEARAGIAIGRIGAVLQSAGKLALARERHAEAIAIHVATRSRRAEGVERSFLAVATHRAGAVREAVALHEAALAIHRETGHARLEGAELLHLAFVRHELDERERARADFERARGLLAAAGATGLEAIALVLAARLDVDDGKPTPAMLALAEAARIAPPSWPRLRATHHLVLGHLALSRGEVARARDAYAAAREASAAVEVGFEALTPAWLALATMRADSTQKESAVALLAEARARLSAIENPRIAEALAVLEAGVLGGAPPRVDDASLAVSSEVRRAVAFAGARRPLAIARSGRRMVLPDGRTVDLAKRKNVVRILAALFTERLAHPGHPIAPAALLEVGWPDERMRADAAQKRLHTAIWTLRTLGLEGILRTEEAGYLLDPSVAVEPDEQP